MNQSLPLHEPDPTKTLVVFGCHPDDAECMAGGLVARHADAGGRAVLVHMTSGAGQPKGVERARRAAEILGAEAAFFHTHEFDVTQQAVDALHDALEQFRPALFVPLWPLDMHPHHSAFAFLCYRACVDVLGGGDSRLRDGSRLWFGELNPGVNCRSFQPSVYVDITDTTDRKWRAMGCYAEDCDGSAADAVRAWGWFGESQVTVERFRGYECGCARAEAFAAYGGWDESPLDRPWGVPMFPERGPRPPWYEGKIASRELDGEHRLQLLTTKQCEPD